MKRILSEKNLVLMLFVLAFITFTLAHEDTKKIERAYTGIHSSVSISIASFPPKPLQPGISYIK